MSTRTVTLVRPLAAASLLASRAWLGAAGTAGPAGAIPVGGPKPPPPEAGTITGQVQFVNCTASRGNLIVHAASAHRSTIAKTKFDGTFAVNLAPDSYKVWLDPVAACPNGTW